MFLSLLTLTLPAGSGCTLSTKVLGEPQHYLFFRASLKNLLNFFFVTPQIFLRCLVHLCCFVFKMKLYHPIDRLLLYVSRWGAGLGLGNPWKPRSSCGAWALECRHRHLTAEGRNGPWVCPPSPALVRGAPVWLSKDERRVGSRPCIFSLSSLSTSHPPVYLSSFEAFSGWDGDAVGFLFVLRTLRTLNHILCCG